MAEIALVTCYNAQGELLLGKRRDNSKWTLPGGHLNEGESPEEGAKRELWEETGLQPQSLSYVTDYLLDNGERLHVFSSYVTGEPHGNNDPDQEVENWKWFETSDLPSNLQGPKEWDKNILLRIFGVAMRKAENLEKGSFQARHKFNPDLVDPQVEYDTGKWQGSDREPDSRDMVPYLDGPERVRALHRLAAVTSVRRGPNGERQFLLHRGVGNDELTKITAGPGRVEHRNEMSSWTPRHNIALNFAHDYVGYKHPRASAAKNVVSAWIPESAIHSIPNQLGRLNPGNYLREEEERKGRGENEYSPEHEVIVAPHQSDSASAEEVASAAGENRNVDDVVSSRGHSGNTAMLQYSLGKLSSSSPHVVRARQFGNPNQGWLPKVEKAEDEVSRLLDHPDPTERLMALRLKNAGQLHAQQAALDSDPTVFQAAINHPQFDDYAGLHVLESDADQGGQYPLAQKLAVLARPTVAKFHVGAAIRAAETAPPDVAERLHEAVVTHPQLSPAYARELYQNPAVSFPNRLKLMVHPEVPVDVLNQAIQTGLLVPSHESGEIAKAAAAHPDLPDSVKDSLVRRALDTIHPHIQAIAQHALANNIIPNETIKYILQRAHANSSIPTHLGLVGAALKGPAVTEEHIQQAMALPDPKAMGEVLGARGLKPEHVAKINERINQPLTKSIDPAHFRGFTRALETTGAKTVDHTPHLSAHPQSIGPEVEAFKGQILDSRTHAKRLGGAKDFGGISKKVVYQAQVAGQDDLTKFMIKPYHERPIRQLKAWCVHPIQGWAEMTNQALYHAGGIGHLHQKVHVTEHDMGPGHEHEPALVVHMENGMDLQHHYGAVAPDVHDDVRKIALMDFLTNNLDRHGENLLVSDRHGERERIVAIDHGRSFQYMSPKDKNTKWLPASKKATGDLEDTFGDYHWDSALNSASRFTPMSDNGTRDWHDRQMETLRSYAPVFDWWGEVSPKVRDEFSRHLEQIKDPDIRAHLKRNFEARADWLDERAKFGLENYGTNWHQDKVPMYRPGELTEQEKREQWEAKRREPLRKALVRLADYVKMKRMSKNSQDWPYAYHVTPTGFLPSISQRGLEPRYHEHAGEPVIFVEPIEEEAAIYHQPGQTSMLRFRVPGFGTTEDGENVHHDIVSPHDIEVKHNNDGTWQPLVSKVQ